MKISLLQCVVSRNVEKGKVEIRAQSETILAERYCERRKKRKFVGRSLFFSRGPLREIPFSFTLVTSALCSPSVLLR